MANVPLHRKIAAASLIAALLGPASPAMAAPAPDQLQKGLLTAAEAPPGYKLAPKLAASTDVRYPATGTMCANKPKVTDVRQTKVALRGFLEPDGTIIVTMIGAPGAKYAQASVKAAADTPARCPNQQLKDEKVTTTKLILPNLGKPAAGVRQILTRKDGTQERLLQVGVSDGDVAATFVQSQGDVGDEAEFLRFVAAGVKKLSLIPR
jgi:hypothetical protein